MAWAETNEPQSQKNVCIANAWSAMTGLWWSVGVWYSGVVWWYTMVWFLYSVVDWVWYSVWSVCVIQWCGSYSVCGWLGVIQCVVWWVWYSDVVDVTTKWDPCASLLASNHITCNARKMPGHCSHWWLGALDPMGASFYERVTRLQSTP